jgi:ubiquinone/menaquinone biosynthesis C-methylase UbiE
VLKLKPVDVIKLTNKTYEKIAKIYSDKYFEDSSALQFIDKFLSLLPAGSRILDMGSGPGNFAKYILSKNFQVQGIDLSKEMIKIAREKVPNVKFQLMDMRNLKFPTNSFDGLLVAYSLIHIPSNEILDTLRGFNKILKNNGKILIIAQAGEPDRIVDETLVEGGKIFLNFFTRKRIKDYLEEAGFKIVFQKEKQTSDLDSFSNRVIYTIATKH